MLNIRKFALTVTVIHKRHSAVIRPYSHEMPLYQIARVQLQLNIVNATFGSLESHVVCARSFGYKEGEQKDYK